MDEPKSISDYVEWARVVLKDDLGADVTRRIYDTNIAAALNAIQQTPFSRELNDFLIKCEQEYRSKTGTSLRMSTSSLEFSAKSFESVVNKLFRQNVVWNRAFPKAPQGGWVISRDVYSRLDDLVRTTVVCKFLDGPEFLSERFVAFATGNGLLVEARSLERDDGYYAFHVYTSFAVELTDQAWALAMHTMKTEIQITTQLQEILRDLTHRYYEQVRLERAPDRKAWKWRSNDPRFRAGFLSHSLHLLEGLILELRDAGGSPNE